MQNMTINLVLFKVKTLRFSDEYPEFGNLIHRTSHQCELKIRCVLQDYHYCAILITNKGLVMKVIINENNFVSSVKVSGNNSDLCDKIYYNCK